VRLKIKSAFNLTFVGEEIIRVMLGFPVSLDGGVGVGVCVGVGVGEGVGVSEGVGVGDGVGEGIGVRVPAKK